MDDGHEQAMEADGSGRIGWDDSTNHVRLLQRSGYPNAIVGSIKQPCVGDDSL
jgi:hypothetical protein